MVLLGVIKPPLLINPPVVPPLLLKPPLVNVPLPSLMNPGLLLGPLLLFGGLMNGPFGFEPVLLPVLIPGVNPLLNPPAPVLTVFPFELIVLPLSNVPEPG